MISAKTLQAHKLVSLSSGQFHCDLIRKLGLGSNVISKPFLVVLPFRDENSRLRMKPSIHVPTHEFLASTFASGEFRKYFSGPEHLGKFFHHVGQSNACLAGHPLCSIPDYKHKVVPLRLHGTESRLPSIGVARLTFCP